MARRTEASRAFAAVPDAALIEEYASSGIRTIARRHNVAYHTVRRRLVGLLTLHEVGWKTRRLRAEAVPRRTDQWVPGAVRKALGAELRRIRDSLYLSRASVVHRLESRIGEGGLDDYERGKSCSVEQLVDMCLVYGCDPGALVTHILHDLGHPSGPAISGSPFCMR